MMFLLFVLAALATWRVSSLLARERGVFAVFTVLRTLLGVEHDLDGTPRYDDDGDVVLFAVTPYGKLNWLLSELAAAMTCTWCNSLWVALPVTLFIAHQQPLLVYDGISFLFVVLALSAATILIDRLVVRE